jgi:flagella basal body P-ring formation protein FlgA
MGPVVRLGDVVDRCDDVDLAATKLVPSPRWGRTRVLSRDEILKRLLRVTTDKIRFAGSERVSLVRRGGDRAGEIRGLVEAAIEAQVRTESGLSYELAFPGRPVMLPWGNMSVACNVPDEPLGARVVSCRISVDGSLVKTMNVTCRFARQIEVPVAARRLSRGDTIRTDDVVWEVRTIESRNTDAVPRSESFEGYLVKRTVRKGEIVPVAALERQPAIVFGQVVDLVIQRSAVRITTKARALQKGWVGSRIRLQNLMNKSYVYGRVSARGVVIYE